MKQLRRRWIWEGEKCAAARKFCVRAFYRDSVEVVRTGGSSGELQRSDALGADRDDVVLMLEDAFDEHEAHRYQLNAIFFEEVGRDDGVGDAGFIFQTQ